MDIKNNINNVFIVNKPAFILNNKYNFTNEFIKPFVIPNNIIIKQNITVNKTEIILPIPVALPTVMKRIEPSTNEQIQDLIITGLNYYVFYIIFLFVVNHIKQQ
jgi:hypothetical protein